MSRPLQYGGGGGGVRKQKLFFFHLGSVKGNGPPGAPAGKYITVSLIKAISRSTCPIASIRQQIKKLSNVLLTVILIRTPGWRTEDGGWRVEDAVSQCLPTKQCFRIRQRKPERASPKCLLKCHLRLSEVISLKNLWEKVKADKQIESVAGSCTGLFSPLISLVGCICCRLSPETHALYQRDGIWGVTVKGKKELRMSEKDRCSQLEWILPCNFSCWSYSARFTQLLTTSAFILH